MIQVRLMPDGWFAVIDGMYRVTALQQPFLEKYDGGINYHLVIIHSYENLYSQYSLCVDLVYRIQK